MTAASIARRRFTSSELCQHNWAIYARIGKWTGEKDAWIFEWFTMVPNSVEHSRWTEILISVLISL